MTHVCKLSDPWPTGHPLPAEDPAKLVGPAIGDEVTYHRVRRTGHWNRDLQVTEWAEEVADLPATVLARSYVWSPGECRHRGGYRRYDWTVIRVFEPGHTYEVVVDDKDLTSDGEWCLHCGSDTCQHAARHNAAYGGAS